MSSRLYSTSSFILKYSQLNVVWKTDAKWLLFWKWNFLENVKRRLSSAQSVIKSCMYLHTMCFSELIHCNRSATIDFANTFIFIHDILMCFFSFGSYLVWIENGWLSTEHASTLDVIHINYTFNPMTLWKVSSSLIWRMQPRLTF